jgi:hypothetical protein
VSSTPPPTAGPAAATSYRRRAERTRPRIRLRGGPDGNAQLTAATGVILLILLAVLGVTIVRIGQLIWVHLFLGLLLIGPVGLKMGSTGYRFVRYYTHSPAYRRKGAPETWLRMLAPAVVVSTVVVFVSGVLLLFEGPAHRSTLLLIHKVSFFAWLAVTGLHVLGHLPGMRASLRIRPEIRPRVPGHASDGGAGRAIALIGALVGGVVLALVLIPDFSVWTSAGSAVFHHRHHS